MKKTILLALLVFMGVGFVKAQTTVTGKVTSADNGEPLPFVTVVVKGFSVVRTTGNDGVYSINVPAGGETLVFSFSGMQTTEVNIGNRSVVDAVLEPDIALLDEVMVVAYGTVKKGGFTGAAISLDSKSIEQRPVTSVTSVLEGSTGIMTMSASGQPGSSASIRVRGAGSINASSSPLIVVDGFPYDGAVADISPGDIENVTILKDASSSALYGSRAANGVIMITTKKGRKGSLNVNFRTTQGVTTRGVGEYEKIGAYKYVPLMWEAYRNSEMSGGATAAAAAATASADIMGSKGLGYNVFGVVNGDVMRTDGTMNPNARITYGDYDWEDAITRAGYRGEYNLSANGATEKTSYMFSLGYLKEEGYIIRSGLERMNARANVDVTPTKWFKTGANVTVATSESTDANAETSNSSGYNNPMYFSRYIAPIYPIYKHNADGSYMLDDEGGKIYEWDGRPYSAGRHIVAEMEWNTRLYERTTLGSRAFAEFTFIEGLKLNLNVGFDKRNSYFTRYENPQVGDGSPAGRGTKNSYGTQNWNYNQLLTYDKSFGLHNMSLLAGHESYEYKYDYFYAMKTGVISEWNPELINFSTVSSLTSYKYTLNHEGYFFRANYDYDNKYYVSASFRRDGSSRFHKDSRWGNFWSIGGSWRMDRERFMNNITWLDMLKLRAAYGITGNDDLYDSDGYSTYYPWMDLYDIQRNGNTAGYILSTNSGNSNLEWEKSSSIDVAAEFSLFNHRLRGSIEFYRRISDNLLFNVKQTISSGIDSQSQNIGTMYNQGFEFDISGDILRIKDFTWTLNVTAATLKNRITKLPNREEIADGSYRRLAEGHNRYSFYLRTWAGVNSQTGAAMYILDENSSYSASDVYEYNGVRVTENQNYAKYDWHGKATPDVYGSFTNTFSYKDLTLGILFTYGIGGKIYDNTYANLMSAGTYGTAVHPDILNRWQNPGDETDVPRMDASKTSAFNAISSRWLTNASYLSLKSVTLSYTLPKKWANKIDLSNIQVYLSGENLGLFSARKGLNPSQVFTGLQYNAYSPARVFTFGLNLSF